MPYEGLVAESVTVRGFRDEAIEAYWGRPLGAGPVPGVIVIHHAPGWDEWTREVVRKLAHHGYMAISPHLYARHGPGTPDDAAARGRAAGGMRDDEVMGDVQGSIDFLRAQPQSNGKIGIIGFCSGGRHVYLAACTLPGIDAAVDCWGGNVVVDDPAALTDARPVAPIDFTSQMTAPLMGIFGNEDQNPTPEHVNRTEEALRQNGKNYQFHRYDGAGHGFFSWYRPAYRQEQATDAWGKILEFYAQNLSTQVPAAAGAR